MSAIQGTLGSTAFTAGQEPEHDRLSYTPVCFKCKKEVDKCEMVFKPSNFVRLDLGPPSPDSPTLAWHVRCHGEEREYKRFFTQTTFLVRSLDEFGPPRKVFTPDEEEGAVA